MADEPDIEATGPDDVNSDTDPLGTSSDVDTPDQVTEAADEDQMDDPADADDELSGHEEEDGGASAAQSTVPPFADRQVCSQGNAQVLGTLTLSYPTRDVEVFVDGDAALRLLTIFKRGREAGLADLLDPYISSARAAWVVADLLQAPPLAMSWMPGLPTPRQRTAMDPALPCS